MSDRRRAWAAALFDAEPDAASRAGCYEALEAIVRLRESEPRFASLLRDPAVTGKEKSDFLAAAGGKDPVFARFCELLVEKGRASLLPEIAAEYRAAMDRDEGRTRLVIEAAREPEAETRERLGEAWMRFAGAKAVETTTVLKPELIAGYRLRSGSVRYDYSVAGRIERLRRRLTRPSETGPAGQASDRSAPGEG